MMQPATQLQFTNQLSPGGQCIPPPQPIHCFPGKVGRPSPQQYEAHRSKEQLLPQPAPARTEPRRIPRLRAVVESQAFKNILVDEMDMMLSRAATLIQANWRGYRLRQKLISQMMAAKAIQEAWRRFNTRRLLRSSKVTVKRVTKEEGNIPYHPPQQVRFQPQGERPPAQPLMMSKETQFPSSDSLAPCVPPLALLQHPGPCLPEPGVQAAHGPGAHGVAFLPHQTIAISLPSPVSLDPKCQPCLLTKTIRSACVIRHMEGDTVKTKQVTARATKAGAPEPPPPGRYGPAVPGAFKGQPQAHGEAEAHKTPPQACPASTLSRTPPKTYPLASVTRTQAQVCPMPTVTKIPPQTCPGPTVTAMKTLAQTGPAPAVTKTHAQMRPSPSLTTPPLQTRLAATMAKIPPQVCLLASVIRPPPPARPAATPVRPPPQTYQVSPMTKPPPQMRLVTTPAKNQMQTCPAAPVPKTPSQICPGASIMKPPPQTRLAAMITKTPAQIRSVAAVLRTLCLVPPVVGSFRAAPQPAGPAGIPTTSSNIHLSSQKAKVMVNMRQTTGVTKDSSHSYLAEGKVRGGPQPHLEAGAPKPVARGPLEPEKIRTCLQRQMRRETGSRTNMAMARPSSWTKVTEDRNKTQAQQRIELIKVQSQVYVPVEAAAALPRAQAAAPLTKTLCQTRPATRQTKALPQEQLATPLTKALSQVHPVTEQAKALCPQAHLVTGPPTVIPQPHLVTRPTKTTSQVHLTAEHSKVLSQAHLSTHLAKGLAQPQLAAPLMPTSPVHVPARQTKAAPQAHLATGSAKTPPQVYPSSRLTKTPSLAHLVTCLTKTQSQVHLTTGAAKVQSQAQLPVGLTKTQSQAQLLTKTTKSFYAVHQPADLNSKTQSQPLLAGSKASAPSCQHLGPISFLSRAKPEERPSQLQPQGHTQSKTLHSPCPVASEAQSMLVPLMTSAGRPTCNVESWGDSRTTRTQPPVASPGVPCQEAAAASQIASLCAELAAVLGSQEDIRALLAKALSQGEVRAALNQALSKDVLGTTMTKALPQGMLGMALVKALSWGELGITLSRALSRGELRSELTKVMQGKLAEVLSKALTDEERAALGQALCQGELGAVLSQSLSQAALRTGTTVPKATSKTAGSGMTLLPASVEVDCRGKPSAAWGPAVGPGRLQPSKVRVSRVGGWEDLARGQPAGLLEEMGDGATLEGSPCWPLFPVGMSLTGRMAPRHQHPLVVSLDLTQPWEREPVRVSYLSPHFGKGSPCLTPRASPVAGVEGPHLPRLPGVQPPPRLWQSFIVHGIGSSTSQISVTCDNARTSHRPHAVGRVTCPSWALPGEGGGALGRPPGSVGSRRPIQAQPPFPACRDPACWCQFSGARRVSPKHSHHRSVTRGPNQPAKATEAHLRRAQPPSHKQAFQAPKPTVTSMTSSCLRTTVVSKGQAPKCPAGGSLFKRPRAMRLGQGLSWTPGPRQKETLTQNPPRPREHVTSHQMSLLNELVSSLPQHPDDVLARNCAPGSMVPGPRDSESQSSLQTCSSHSFSAMSVASLTRVELVDKAQEGLEDQDPQPDFLLSQDDGGRPQRLAEIERSERTSPRREIPDLYWHPSTTPELTPVLGRGPVSSHLALSVHWDSEDEKDGLSLGQSSVDLVERVSQETVRPGLRRSLSLGTVATSERQQSSLATKLALPQTQPALACRVAPNLAKSILSQPLVAGRLTRSLSQPTVSIRVHPSGAQPSAAARPAPSPSQPRAGGRVFLVIPTTSLASEVSSGRGGCPSGTGGEAPSSSPAPGASEGAPRSRHSSAASRGSASLAPAALADGVAPAQSHCSEISRVTPGPAQPPLASGVSPNLAQPSVAIGVSLNFAQPPVDTGLSPSLAKPSVATAVSPSGLSPSLVQSSVASGVSPNLAQPSLGTGTSPSLAQPSMASEASPTFVQPSTDSGVSPSPTQPPVASGVSSSFVKPSMTSRVSPSLTQPLMTSGVSPSLAQPLMTSGVSPSLAQPSMTSGASPSLAQPPMTSGVSPSLTQPSLAPGVSPSLAQPPMGSGMSPNIAPPSVTTGVSPSLPHASMASGVSPLLAQPPVAHGMSPSLGQPSMASGVSPSPPHQSVASGVAQSPAQPCMASGVSPSLGQSSLTSGASPGLPQASLASGLSPTFAQPSVANGASPRPPQRSAAHGVVLRMSQPSVAIGMSLNLANLPDAQGAAPSLGQPSMVSGLSPSPLHLPMTSGMAPSLAQPVASGLSPGLAHQPMASGLSSGPSQRCAARRRAPKAPQPSVASRLSPTFAQHSVASRLSPGLAHQPMASGLSPGLAHQPMASGLSPGLAHQPMASGLSPGLAHQPMASGLSPGLAHQPMASGLSPGLAHQPMASGLSPSLSQPFAASGLSPGPSHQSVAYGVAPTMAQSFMDSGVSPSLAQLCMAIGMSPSLAHPLMAGGLSPVLSHRPVADHMAPSPAHLPMASGVSPSFMHPPMASGMHPYLAQPPVAGGLSPVFAQPFIAPRAPLSLTQHTLPWGVSQGLAQPSGASGVSPSLAHPSVANGGYPVVSHQLMASGVAPRFIQTPLPSLAVPRHTWPSHPFLAPGASPLLPQPPVATGLACGLPQPSVIYGVGRGLCESTPEPRVDPPLHASRVSVGAAGLCPPPVFLTLGSGRSYPCVLGRTGLGVQPAPGLGVGVCEDPVTVDRVVPNLQDSQFHLPSSVCARHPTALSLSAPNLYQTAVTKEGTQGPNVFHPAWLQGMSSCSLEGPAEAGRLLSLSQEAAPAGLAGSMFQKSMAASMGPGQCQVADGLAPLASQVLETEVSLTHEETSMATRMEPGPPHDADTGQATLSMYGLGLGPSQTTVPLPVPLDHPLSAVATVVPASFPYAGIVPEGSAMGTAGAGLSSSSTDRPLTTATVPSAVADYVACSFSRGSVIRGVGQNVLPGSMVAGMAQSPPLDPMASGVAHGLPTGTRAGRVAPSQMAVSDSGAQGKRLSLSMGPLASFAAPSLSPGAVASDVGPSGPLGSVKTGAQGLAQGSMLIGLTPRPYHGAGEGPAALLQAPHAASLAQARPQASGAQSTTKGQHRVPAVLSRASPFGQDPGTRTSGTTEDPTKAKPGELGEALAQEAGASRDSSRARILEVTPWLYQSPAENPVDCRPAPPRAAGTLARGQSPLWGEGAPSQAGGVASVHFRAKHSVASSVTTIRQSDSASSGGPPSSCHVAPGRVRSVSVGSAVDRATSPPLTPGVSEDLSALQLESMAHMGLPSQGTMTSDIFLLSPHLAPASPVASSLHAGSVAGTEGPGLLQRPGTGGVVSQVQPYQASVRDVAGHSQMAAVPSTFQKPVSVNLTQTGHKSLRPKKYYRLIHGKLIPELLEGSMTKVVISNQVQRQETQSSPGGLRPSPGEPWRGGRATVHSGDEVRGPSVPRQAPRVRRVSLGYTYSSSGLWRPLLEQDSHDSLSLATRHHKPSPTPSVPQGQISRNVAGPVAGLHKPSLTPAVLQGPVDAGMASGVPSVAVRPMDRAVAPQGVWEPARGPLSWDARGRMAAVDPRQPAELVVSAQTVERMIVQATVVIQAYARGYLVRSTVRVWHQCATLIQASWRGFRVRRNLARLYRATTIIQAAWRGYCTRRDCAQQMLLPVWVELGSKVRAAPDHRFQGSEARLGSDHRCFQSCQPHICSLCQSLSPGLGSPPSVVMLVGSSPRTCHMCGHTLPTRVVHGMGTGRSASGQGGVLWACGSQKAAQSPCKSPGQNRAAMAIQSAWRGFRTRRQLRQQQTAAKMVQSNWRGHYTRSCLTTDMLLGSGAPRDCSRNASRLSARPSRWSGV